MSIFEVSQILGNFGEFIGAIAVVATLIYLANQVRESSISQQSSVSWSFTQAINNINEQRSSDAELTDIWLRGKKEFTSLDEVERERFRSLWLSMLNLSVYIHSHPTVEHDFYNNTFLAQLISESSELREMVDAIKSSLDPALYDQLTK